MNNQNAPGAESVTRLGGDIRALLPAQTGRGQSMTPLAAAIGPDAYESCGRSPNARFASGIATGSYATTFAPRAPQCHYSSSSAQVRSRSATS